MLTTRRNRDFRRRCREIYDDISRCGRTPDINDIIRRAIASPAPSFYIDPEYAYNKVLRLLRHGVDTLRPTPAACLWMELTAMVRAELLRRPGTISDALGYVLNFRHPSAFHITPRLARRILAGEFERRVIHRPRRPRSKTESEL